MRMKTACSHDQSSIQFLRSSLIHFACIGVGPLNGHACSETIRGGATLMQAKWIKFDLTISYDNVCLPAGGLVVYCLVFLTGVNWFQNGLFGFTQA